MLQHKGKSPPISTKKSNRTPPRKKPGQCKGKRAFNNTGAILELDGLSNWLGPSQGTLYGRAMRGEMPYRKLGGRIIFLWSEIEEWLKSLPGRSLEEVLKIQKARGDES
jgi:predicted DNA-binding transcriptional regulator AlpA